MDKIKYVKNLESGEIVIRETMHSYGKRPLNILNSKIVVCKCLVRIVVRTYVNQIFVKCRLILCPNKSSLIRNFKA